MISSLSSTQSISRTRGVGKGGSQWLGPCDENEYRLDQIRGPYLQLDRSRGDKH